MTASRTSTTGAGAGEAASVTSGFAVGVAGTGVGVGGSGVAVGSSGVGTLLFERWILWRYRERTKPYALSMDNMKLLKGKLDDHLEYVGQAANLRVYLRERRGFTYGLHFYHSSGKDTSKTGQERLSYLQQVAGALAEWKNGLEVTPSLSLAES